MNNLKRFIPGLRILKTFLAVFLCLVLFSVVGYGYPIHAAIACVLMMKATPEETIEMGKYRVLGTLMGAFFSFFAVSIMRFFNVAFNSLYMDLIISLSVLFSFMLCKGFSLDSSIASMSAVIIIIMLMSADIVNGSLLINVSIRTVETLIGILIAFVINRYINFPAHSV